jgi:WD40 repeat protein
MSADDTLQVWNASTGCHLLTYHPSGWLRENPFDGVRANAVAWSPDGVCLAVAGCDGKIRVLHVEIAS